LAVSGFPFGTFISILNILSFLLWLGFIISGVFSLRFGFGLSINKGKLVIESFDNGFLFVFFLRKCKIGY